MADESVVQKAERVWCDGCYDMVHFGHANQLRQAKLFGKKLIVGVHNDEEVTLHKGPPVFNEQERYRMVRGIKWVDEFDNGPSALRFIAYTIVFDRKMRIITQQVVENAPYSTTVATLDQYACDFCVHGDDITLTADGHDTYAEVKKAGRYMECKRTAGVSTTDLVGRMLLLTKTHHSHDCSMEAHKERARTLSTNQQAVSPWTRVSHFIPSSRTLLEFAQGVEPKPTDKIVYVSGAFDLFHIGHLSFLEEARKLGDYLIVGIITDKEVNQYKGGNHPIMNLHERVLSVLAYRPVNEVVIGAPYDLTDAIIDQFNISIVAQGSRVPHHEVDGIDPFAAAKRRGMFRLVDSQCDMTTEMIIKRIIDHRIEYETRNRKKEMKELAAVAALRKMQNGTNGKLDTMRAIVIDTSAIC